MLIRRAAPSDARALATLNVRAWQWAYRGLLPDAFLDGLSMEIEQRIEGTRRRIEAESGEQRIWVVQQAEVVVGFAITGASRDPGSAPTTAEVQLLYLDPDVVGTGIGRALFAHAVADLAERGYTEATLWVLEGNQRARRFYEAAGWVPDGEAKTEERPFAVFHEVRYRATLAPHGPL
jgi:ribosomal protein S18 acetylase RimI-like enzyme